MNNPNQSYIIENQLHLDFGETLKKDVRLGLSGDQKWLPSKYFYDEVGSELFEQICQTPEYYVTRTELELLESIAPEVMAGFPEGELVELGSGAHWKIQRLIDAATPAQRDQLCYRPVDVSEDAIRGASEALHQKFPNLKIRGLVQDFTKPETPFVSERPVMMVLFGSSIGNFGFEEASKFLAQVSAGLKPGDRFLLSVDRVKPLPVLHAAYNDQAGKTAAFNKNVLTVLNRHLEADFSLDDFGHHAFFNREDERVEMHLVAQRPVSAKVKDLGLDVNFEKGESIHTEISQKYSQASALSMVEKAGLELVQWYHAENEWFSIMELKKA